MEIVINPLATTPEGEPFEVVAGDTWTWKRSDLASEFPLATYQLTYAFKLEGSTNAPTTIVATESGSEYLVTYAAASSASWTPGTWRWTAVMTRTSDSARVQIATGAMVVRPNPTASTADPRSHAQKMLAAIEALLEGRSVQDVNSYSIKDRSLTKMTPEELMSWRDYYRSEVNRERIAERRAAGKSTGRTTVVRFR